MKRIAVRTTLCILICLASSTAHASLFTFTPPDADIYDLEHQYYYTWGIISNLPDEEIVEATLYIDKINNWKDEVNYLYIHLLDTNSACLDIGTDWQGGGDAFSGQGIPLTTYSDTDGTYGYESSGVNWSYGFTASQLVTLNQYASDNKFGFGFDPDCHFWNDGVSFEIATVPEPASMLLFGIGALGFGVARRKRF